MARIKKYHDLTDEKINESLLDDPNFIAGAATIATIGGGMLYAVLSKLGKAKTPEEKKKALEELRKSLDDVTGAG